MARVLCEFDFEIKHIKGKERKAVDAVSRKVQEMHVASLSIFQSYLRRVFMDEIHQAPYSGHPGYHKTIATARKQYFWPGMKKDMAKYISRCMKCQQVKVEHQHPAGLLQPLPVPEWTWEVISMDFITGLPMTWRQHDSIMVVVDKLTKETHFILVKSRHKTNDITKIFMKEIFKLH